MSPSFRFDLLADIDDQSPARRRLSAFRRYRELMPRDAQGTADTPSYRVESHSAGDEHRNAAAIRPDRTSAH